MKKYLKAIKKAFPKLNSTSMEIIAQWYENEEALDDFDNLDDFVNYIKDDITDMLEASVDDDYEHNSVVEDLVKNQYI